MMRRALLALLCAVPALATADNTAQNLPFTQDWSNAALISANDDWAGVPGIVGYRGDDITTLTGVDPQTLVGEGTITVDVNANQTNPDTFNTGGVTEFAITNPVVALTGSGTADAPNIIININTTALTAIRVQYNLRDIDGSVDNSVQPVALQYRVGNTGNFINVPAGFVADASSGPSLATQVTAVDATLPVGAENLPLVQVRVMTTNAAGNDEWIGIDDINITGTGAGGNPFINVGDLALAEGTGGIVVFGVPVTLSGPAPAGGVSFTATTADGTATGPGDYTPQSAVAYSIAATQTSTVIPINITADNIPEPNETFTVTIANVTNAIGQDLTGQITLNNDDLAAIEIFALQGNTVSSPFVGQQVLLNNNVVTATASNGFFIQTPTARDDANANTSNAVFVFTSTAPTAVVGDSVNVSGTVEEFFGFTQVSGSPIVTVNSGGNALPAPIVFDATRPSGNPAAPSCTVTASPDVETSNFECFEAMRVQITGGSIGDGNQRFASDLNAEVRITAGPRAFREIGVVFPGLGGTIPVWDGNPEVFELDVNRLEPALGNPVLTGGSTFNATGVLGYEFSDFELWPTALNLVTTNALPVPAAVPEAGAMTVGSINLLRFCNDQNDPGPVGNCTPVLAPAEFTRRLVKTSAYIRTQMRAPNIVAVVEMENLATLQALATQISTDDPSLVYTAFLAEGNDVGGIDNGFLVRVGATSVVSPVATQLDLNLTGNATTCTGGAGTCRVHDRPPYLLTGTWGPTAQPFAIMVNHTRSFLDIETVADGPRIRSKRLEQAQAIAQQVQNFQIATPNTPLVLVGDYNAFEFTDGYVDVINQIRGTAVPAQNLVSGPNITNPILSNPLNTLPAAQRYSYTFGGSAQTIDHVLLTTAGQREFIGYSFVRSNADAAVDLFNAPLATSPLRVSDHEGVVVRLRMLGADVAPTVAYAPAANGTVAFTGQALIGSTANGSIAVTASGGSGVPGAPTTTTVNGCVISSVSPGGSFAGFGQSLSFVAANAPLTGSLSGTCVAAAAATTAVLTCQENRAGSPAAPRSWTLSCPAGNATPLLSATPAAGSTIDFGNVVVGDRVLRSIGLSNTGTGTVQLSNCAVTGNGFTLVSPGSFSIAPGASAAINLSWRALSLGAVNGTLTCETNVAGLATISWPLAGLGVAPIVTQVPAIDGQGRLLLLIGMLGFGIWAARRRLD